MGKLACRCGVRLSNVDCPNDVELWGFEGKVINELLEIHPEERIPNVAMGYSINDFYFWQCTECGRVYRFKKNQRMYDKVYLRRDCNENIQNILSMRELYFFTDKQIEDPSEKDFDYSIKQFLDNPPHPYRFYVAEHQDKVYAYNTLSRQVDYCYIEEK